MSDHGALPAEARGGALLSRRRFCVAAAAAGALLCAASAPAAAETGGSGWSAPELLFESDAMVRTPWIVSDRYGGLHVFWRMTGWPEDSPEYGTEALYYAHWDGAGWTMPTDIIVGSFVSPSLGTADDEGRIHVLWSGQMTYLYYSSASVATASVAAEWSSPVIVGAAQLHGQIAVDPAGRLHRVFAGQGSRGPYHQLSADGGATWSNPVNVSPTAGPKSAADWVRVAVGDDGAIHVVWTEFQLPNGWPPIGVFYARSTDRGRTWADQVVIAAGGYDQINVAVGPGGAVHVAWNGAVGNPGGRYHRWSPDGGQTWSNLSAVVKPGLGGTEGPPQIAVDSAGALHLLTTYQERVWYASWQGQRWTETIYVPSGDETGVGLGKQLTEAIRWIEEPAMAISRGNQVHAVFWDRRNQEHSYLWHTSKQLTAPAIAPRPYPTPTPPASAMVVPTPAATPVPTATAAPSWDATLEAAMPETSQAVALDSLWPVPLAVGGALLLSLTRSRSR